MARYNFTKNEPPTAFKALASTVTGATPNTVTEHVFGLSADKRSESLFIRNDGTAVISISLDGGLTFFDVSVGGTVECEVARTSLHAKSASASQSFTVLVGGEF